MAGESESYVLKQYNVDNIPSTADGKVAFAWQNLASGVQERYCESNIVAAFRRDKTCGM